VISLTESAATKIKTMLETRDDIGIRPGVQGGGCSGFSYKLEFVKQEQDKDRIIEDKGVKIYIDPKSYLYLMGTEIDYIDDLNQAGFKFVNPNAKRTCGCGESFSV
tara:strand:+ start:364 stop:681 length:318 start_codon:yes stop_codon:yes gene_type:complete